MVSRVDTRQTRVLLQRSEGQGEYRDLYGDHRLYMPCKFPSPVNPDSILEGSRRKAKKSEWLTIYPSDTNSYKDTSKIVWVRLFFLTAQHRRSLQWSVRNCICVNQYLAPSHIHIILPVNYINFCLLQKPWQCFSKCSYQVIGKSIIKELHFNNIFMLFPHIEDLEAWI